MKRLTCTGYLIWQAVDLDLLYFKLQEKLTSKVLSVKYQQDLQPRDKYLPQSVAEQFQKGNPAQIQLKLIEGAGHMPQEDW
ncbi:hypothetical protein AAZX31_06G250500 [Glycine max]